MDALCSFQRPLQVKIWGYMARESRRRSRRGSQRSGTNRQDPAILPSSPPLDPPKLKQLYSSMLGCRMLLGRVRLLMPQGVFPSDTCVANGHEALEVGALIHLVDEDCVACDKRGYVARFIRGAALRGIFAELGREAQAEKLLGTPNGIRTVDSVLPGSSVAAQMNQLTGAAWAFKLQNKPQVAVFLSSNRSSSPDWLRDAVSFSATYKLPIVHVVENTQGDRLHVANPDRGSRGGEQAALQERLPCFVVDRNDAVAVYRVAQEAIRRARQGHGPAFIECRTCAAPSRSIPTAALTRDGLEDPLTRMEAHLRSKNLWSDKWKTRLVEKFTWQLDQAYRALQAGRETPIVSPGSTLHPSGAGPAQSAEPKVFETPVTRDSGRLAGSRS